MDEERLASTVPGKTLCRRHHRSLRPMLPALFAQLSGFEGADGGARAMCGSHHHLALGAALCSGTESPSAARIETDRDVLASGSDLSPGRRSLVSLALLNFLRERCCAADAWEMRWRPSRYNVQPPMSLT